MLRYWTAGESHGKTLLALVDGFPAGLTLNTDLIDEDLKRRQGGYGRGGRQRIETDKVEILTGVWQNTTLGSEVASAIPRMGGSRETPEEPDDITGASHPDCHS